MARKQKSMTPVIVEEHLAPANDKAIQAKKKEFREMKARYVQLRETLKSAAAERKSLGERLALMATELGLPFRGGKNPPLSES